MSEVITITTLEATNVKRIRAIRVECSPDGLTIIGGKNGAGKTSVLDAIAYALGGEKRKPSSLQREGADEFAEILVTMSNGLTVRRSGKNGTLKVSDPNGMIGGQKLLDSFVSQFALDLPKFLNASTREKGKVLLQVIGVGDKLEAIEASEKELYAERTQANGMADQAEAYAVNLPMHEGVPNAEVSVAELANEQQQIIKANYANGQARAELDDMANEGQAQAAKCKGIREHIVTLQQDLAEADKELAAFRTHFTAVRKNVSAIRDIDTSSLAEQIANAETTNAKVRANLAKSVAVDDAQAKRKAHAAIDSQLTKTRADKAALLDGADLPLPGLTVEDGELSFNGQKWDCMSGAEQLRVATAIVRKLNPSCGFVLLDKLEQMDLDTLSEFGAWLESEHLQAIATRVSTGDECSIIIEDGTARE